MTITAKDVFSMFECDQIGVKLVGEESFTTSECIGKLNIERETKTVTKKCRGVVSKKKTKPTGNGTITLSLHISRELYRKMNSMQNEGLQPGVYAYSGASAMPEFALTARVLDEDDNIMYKGFPRCNIEEIDATEIENGGEDVLEVEMTISYMPDSARLGEYEALADELTGSVLTAENWMTSFSSEKAKLTTISE